MDAEQSGIQDCFEECGAYNAAEWGAPFDATFTKGIFPADFSEYMRQRLRIGVELPEWSGDFSVLADRLKYGYKACCGNTTRLRKDTANQPTTQPLLDPR